nr:I78 family peptidase inhibitor [Sinirhodobacter sp. WL0062]
MSALAGCAPEEPAPAGCTAADLQDLIGQSETVLASMKFAVPLRVIHPGDMVTMDFRPNRLNFHVDASGKIEKIDCN